MKVANAWFVDVSAAALSWAMLAFAVAIAEFSAVASDEFALATPAVRLDRAVETDWLYTVYAWLVVARYCVYAACAELVVDELACNAGGFAGGGLIGDASGMTRSSSGSRPRRKRFEAGTGTGLLKLEDNLSRLIKMFLIRAHTIRFVTHVGDNGINGI